MKDLVEQLELLKPQISHLVRHRLRKFSELRNSSDASLFKELCYCILTANFTAIRAMKIQETIDDGFCH